MRSYKMIVITLFLAILSSFAMVKANSLAEFCFHSLKTKSKAIHFARQILIKKEKFFEAPNVNCSHIYLSPKRFQLIDAYLRKQFQMKSSSENLGQSFQVQNKSSQCFIEVKELTTASNVSTKVEVLKNGQIKTLRQKSSGSFSSSLLIMSGQSGSVDTPNGVIKLSCQVSNNSMATIDIEKPNQIKTRVLLGNGQGTTIGLSSKNVKNTNHSINFEKGVKHNSAKPISEKVYSLRLKLL